MRILTRYLLRAHLGPFLFSLSVLTGLLLINTVARRFQELAGKGLEPQVIIEVFILSIPYTLALTFPMSVLVAVLYVFSRMTADNEITALKASGVSLKRATLPLLLVSVLMAGLMVWFNDRILPEANHRLKTLLIDINRKSPTLIFKEQTINPIPTGNGTSTYYLQVAQIEPTTNRLYDVVIYDLSHAGRDRTIYADSGRMAFNENNTHLFLTLHDGWVHEREVDHPDRFSRLFYDRQVIRFEEIGNELERSMSEGHRGDREMTSAMLRAEVARRERDIAVRREEASQHLVAAIHRALEPPLEDGSNGEAAPRSIGRRSRDSDRPEPNDPVLREAAHELRLIEGQIEDLELGINRYSVELHKKYAIAFACIVFVLIGVPLAIRFPGGGVGMVIAFSMVIFAIYWMGLTTGEQLGDKGTVAPATGMWVVNVIFLALGIVSTIRLGREMSTARGGAWDEIRFALRQAFVRGRARLRGKEAT